MLSTLSNAWSPQRTKSTGGARKLALSDPWRELVSGADDVFSTPGLRFVHAPYLQKKVVGGRNVGLRFTGIFER